MSTTAREIAETTIDEINETENGLNLQGPWNPALHHYENIAEQTDTTVDKVSSIIPLLADGDILQAGSDEFSIADDYSIPENLEEHLLQNFTQRLIPPKLAAGMFIAANIHPSEGIRVANNWQSRGLKDEDPLNDKIEDSVTIGEFSTKVSTFLSELLEGVLKLDYLSGLLLTATESIKPLDRNTLDLGEEQKANKVQRFLEEFFSDILEPLNIAYLDEGAKIHVEKPEVLESTIKEME